MRKRLLSLVLVVFGLMILSACTDKKIDLDTVADELVNIYQSGDSEKNVTKDLNLKTTTTISNDVVISWNSSNQDIVSNNGKVNRPNDNDVNVELVLTVSYESLEAKRTFNLVVKKTEDVIVEKVSVSFDYWYENAPSGLVIEIDKNTKVTQIEDPIRVGYKFVGWFNGEEKYDFNLNVSADLDLVARWERFLDITLPESVTTSVIEIIRGTEVTLTVNVPNGKELVSLKVNEQIVEVTNNKYTFIATEDIIVLVEFK
ncbi:InlB B-repeat-containing protein, partial [Haploplasma axanthum]